MKFDRTQWIDAYRLATLPLRWCRLRLMQRRGCVPIIVLYYHRVANDFDNPWTIGETQFQQQVDWLQRRFDLVDLAECQRRIRSGHNTRPTVSITFDDGYADNCSFALPLLLERGIPFTYFVTTRHLESGESFPHDAERGCHLAPNSVQTLQELARAGVEIGAHTRTHADIGAIDDPEQLHDELINGIRELESMIHRPIRYFAFPYGMPENMTAVAFRKLHDHGLAGVCSAYGGYNQIGGDPFHLQRIHGDPDFRRLKNWLTWDPRIGARNQFDWRDGDGACPTEDTRPRPIKPEYPESLGQTPVTTNAEVQRVGDPTVR